MMTISIILFIVFVVIFLCMSFIGGYTLLIVPVKGLMIGALYDGQDYPEEEITEHCIQILIWFINFTFIWETPLNNNNNEY
jgi:hypothetical protein